MTAPKISGPRNIHEERACDAIALFWVRHHGGRDEWMEALPDLIDLFQGGERKGRIWLCDVVDTWEEDFGMTGEDFTRLADEIRSWICAYNPQLRRIAA